jgi:hypothetical protein
MPEMVIHLPVGYDLFYWMLKIPTNGRIFDKIDRRILLKIRPK